MAEKKVDQSSLKSKGLLPQRQENMFSMRLKVVDGRVDAEKLRQLQMPQRNMVMDTFI
jgi:anaerobic sulfite reductase subunit C